MAQVKMTRSDPVAATGHALEVQICYCGVVVIVCLAFSSVGEV